MFLVPNMLRTSDCGSRQVVVARGPSTAFPGWFRALRKRPDDADERSGDGSHTGEPRGCRRFAFARSGQGLRSVQTIVKAVLRTARTRGCREGR